MIPREIEKELLRLAKGYPVITLTGPRQSGKTTLARKVFPNKKYISLEDLDTRELAKEDPRSFLKEFPQGGIFDEIQHVPEILSYIQTDVDKTKIMDSIKELEDTYKNNHLNSVDFEKLLYKFK